MWNQYDDPAHFAYYESVSIFDTPIKWKSILQQCFTLENSWYMNKYSNNFRIRKGDSLNYLIFSPAERLHKKITCIHMYTVNTIYSKGHGLKPSAKQSYVFCNHHHNVKVALIMWNFWQNFGMRREWVETQVKVNG